MRILSSTSKPMSSPGRSEKFPPPLMRFLRTKSRGKNTRPKYPLFLRRKKAITSSSTAIEATQEPSSPKVTCIGQVRVTRSKSKSKSSSSSITSLNEKPAKKCCCCCFEKPNVKLWKPNVKKWAWLFNCRSVKVRTDSSKFGSNRFEEKEEKKRESDEREKWSCMQDEEAVVASIKTPPKNALLLTRCRSAPYRSSSLACQFWGSPLRKTGSDEDKENDENEETNIALGIEHRDSTSSSSRRDQDSLSNGRPSIKKDEDLGICVQNEHVKDKDKDKVLLTCSSSPTNKLDIQEVANEKPIIVFKRSKSEPRIRDLCNFDPQSCDFWRHNIRLSNDNSNSNNVSECRPLSHSLP